MLFGVARCSITFGPLFQLDPNRASSSSRCIGANSLGWAVDSQFRVVCSVGLVYWNHRNCLRLNENGVGRLYNFSTGKNILL